MVEEDELDPDLYPECVEDPTVRPCIYVANEGDTLEMISQMFMVPMSRLIYYNLSYAKAEPLEEGARIIIPEPMIMPMNPVRGRQQPKRRK